MQFQSRREATPPCLSAPATRSSMNLVSTLAGCGMKPHSRRACRPDPPRPRSPNPRGGILVSPRLEYVENGVGVLCEGDTADGKKELTVTPQTFMGSTRSSATARSSRWRRAGQKLMALDPQLPATRALPYAGVRKSLPVRNPYGTEHQRTHKDDHRWRGRNGGQNHSLAKRIRERPRSINGSDQNNKHRLGGRCANALFMSAAATGDRCPGCTPSLVSLTFGSNSPSESLTGRGRPAQSPHSRLAP